MPDQTEAAYLYRVGKNGTSLDKAQNIGECEIAEITITPDQLYGTALCERHNHGELRFGRIESRAAVIFDTKTLKILAEVPLDKELYPEFANWHGNGKIVLVTQASSNKLVIYEFAEPKSGSESATVDPRDGSLHLDIFIREAFPEKK